MDAGGWEPITLSPASIVHPSNKVGRATTPTRGAREVELAVPHRSRQLRVSPPPMATPASLHTRRRPRRSRRPLRGVSRSPLRSRGASAGRPQVKDVVDAVRGEVGAASAHPPAGLRARISSCPTPSSRPRAGPRRRAVAAPRTRQSLSRRSTRLAERQPFDDRGRLSPARPLLHA